LSSSPGFAFARLMSVGRFAKNNPMTNLVNAVFSSIRKCKKWIFTIFIFYCVSCFIGIMMVHCKNEFALSYRDKIVSNAVAKENASINYMKGNRFQAAVQDFTGNLFYSAIPQTMMGLGIIFPFFSSAYQGWIGGIVSVDGQHQSRLKEIRSILYYFIVLFLQWVPYSLAIGSGISFGIKTYRLNKGRKLFHLTMDRSAFKDVLNIYLLVIPLFFIASCFEFLSSWNI
jgi:hypothetical protein